MKVKKGNYKTIQYLHFVFIISSMPIFNQFSETIHIHIDTNMYHFVSSEEDYLSSEQVNPFLFTNLQSARTRGGSSG